MAEMVMAMAVLVIALLPLSFVSFSNARDLRATYQKAVATEIIDGEFEILAAGGWQQVLEGTHNYTVHATSATNLPPGEFLISRTAKVVRLQWKATKKLGIGTIAREVKIP